MKAYDTQKNTQRAKSETLLRPLGVDIVRNTYLLSAVEVLLHELQHLLGVALDVAAQCAVVVCAEAADDAVDHCGAEHVVLLEDGALTLKAVG